jgi:hypothetical protein
MVGTRDDGGASIGLAPGQQPGAETRPQPTAARNGDWLPYQVILA